MFNAAYASPLAIDFYGRSRPLKNVSDIGAVENNQVTGTLIIVN